MFSAASLFCATANKQQKGTAKEVTQMQARVTREKARHRNCNNFQILRIDISKKENDISKEHNFMIFI